MKNKIKDINEIVYSLIKYARRGKIDNNHFYENIIDDRDIEEEMNDNRDDKEFEKIISELENNGFKHYYSKIKDKHYYVKEEV